MNNNVYIYILIMAGVSFLIRSLPMTLLKKPIKNKFIQSFLYYVPYVTLAIMTFPAIIKAPQSELAGLIALVAGIFAAWKKVPLLGVSILCCVSVFLTETIIML